jgi:methionyl-tRNA synthetase
MGAVLRVLLRVLRIVATLLQPFMPGSMQRMLDQLGIPAEARTFAALSGQPTPLPEGFPLPAPQGVFPRYVEPAA